MQNDKQDVMGENVAYGWKTCDVKAYDLEQDEEMTSSMRALTDPWQNINKNFPCRKAWIISGQRCCVLPDEVLGQFHTQDVYLLLSMRPGRPDPKHPKAPVLERHLHMWVGKAAPDAAYQVGVAWVWRLDSVLSKECVVYREVQGMESPQFRAYFNPITYLSGGFADGYWMRRVRNEYQPARLLKLYKPDPASNHLVALQRPCRVSELDPASTFVLDVGHSLYLWHGNLTPTDEDLQCTRYVQALKATRGAATRVEALDDDTEIDSHEFFTYLARDTYRDEVKDGEDEHESSTLHRRSTLFRHKQNTDPTQLFKIGVPKKAPIIAQYEKKKDAKIVRADVDRYAVSIVNSARAAFVVLNKKASHGPEAQMGLKLAHDFLKSSKTPFKPIIVLRYKQKSAFLDHTLATS